MSKIGEFITREREKQDISIRGLSKITGISHSEINKIESGEILDREYKEFPKNLYPLWGSEKLLLTIGNHDGCFGCIDGYCYGNQYTPEKIYDTFFKVQTGHKNRHFSRDGSYFYADDEAQKLRYNVQHADR